MSTEHPENAPRPEGWQERAKPIRAQDFSDVKKGDTVTRILAETVIVPPLLVTDVDDEFIYCGADGWKFDRKTGFEVDEELHFGPQWGVTGSRLLRDDKE